MRLVTGSVAVLLWEEENQLEFLTVAGSVSEGFSVEFFF